uniref:TRP C-terminal domain-containing protein n=1 Tax=Amphimedon queenslandica TaxID=400682 RepID=A0A1X7TGK5_AMPQE
MAKVNIVSFLLLHLIVLVQSRSPINISVNTNNQLERLLCDYPPDLYSSDVIITLNSTITHEIRSGNFCTVNISQSLTITSGTDDTLAHINCISNNVWYNDKYWTRGFAFFGINGSLTMRSLNFSNCGTNLTTMNEESLNLINSTFSSVHFTRYHAAVLVFANIGYLYVGNINFIYYSGFAIAAVNLPNASFNYLNVSYSQNFNIASLTKISTGSGVLALFSYLRVSSKNYSRYNLIIANASFENNLAFNQNEHCLTDIAQSSFPIVNAAGITILYVQQWHHYASIPATVIISKTTFRSCLGYLAGAVLILQYNSKLDSQTIINDSTFSDNSLLSKCRGAAITSSFILNNSSYSLDKVHHAITVTNTNFLNNGESIFNIKEWSAGAVYLTVVQHESAIIKPRVNFAFRNVSFVGNIGNYHGVSMYVDIRPTGSQSGVTFLMESITAFRNPDSKVYGKFDFIKLFYPVSVFYFVNIQKLIIRGSQTLPSNFSQNYGSVFEILKSKVVLQGTISFYDNRADYGPAIRLLENSLVYLKNGLRASFTNNKARSLGGAIYAAGGIFLRGFCTFQLLSGHYNNISMSFINNSAQLAGNAIYSQKIFDSNCYMHNERGRGLIKVYGRIFKHIPLTDVVSFGDYIIVCNKKYSYEVYPGALLQIPISVNDSNHHHTFSVLTISFAERTNNQIKRIDWFFEGKQDTYNVIVKGGTNCTSMNFTVHTKQLSESNRRGFLLFSTSNPSKIAGKRITLKYCPPGFKLNPFTGACGCLPNFEKIVNHNSNGKKLLCNIDDVSFTRPYRYLWAGSGKNNSLQYSLSCPPGYCNIHSHHDILKINDTGSFVTSSEKGDSKPLCHGSRTGNLCGECISNHSIVFGSTVCQSCTSNLWLLASIMYILAGPLLVFLLYALKLTLATGTLNSIIFFAQVANARIVGYLKVPCSDCGNVFYFVESSSVFISWLNLNHGFPLCFYNGMTELHKAGLNLCFPVYLIIIISFLGILSKCSSKVSDRLSKSSVQVLVTVVHLSFTQLLQAILSVFKSAEIHIENENSYYTKTVWYYNGTTTYASVEHKWLMIITSVVVGFILIPYMIIILFGKCLLKFDRTREYIRPFFEAIHAPYKANRWYWFAINQLFVVHVYLIDTVQELGNLFFSLIFELLLFLILEVFIAFQACFLPFKNKILNAVNIFLLLSISTTFYIAIYFFHDYPKEVAIFISISFCPTIIIFCVIITYHVLVVTNKLGKLFQLLQSTKTLVSEKLKRKRPVHQRQRAAYYNDIHDTGDYTQAREPLLEWMST